MINKFAICGLIFTSSIACTRSIVNAPTENLKSVVSDAPAVTIVYASLFDEVCSAKYSYPLRQEWKDELLERLLKWRILFDREGMQLLGEAAAIVGQPFRDRSFRVSLSLCSFPSISMPLIVNARYALHSFSAKPISDDVLIGTIVHEILHSYLDYIQVDSAAMFGKFPGVSKSVVDHVYLFALLKAAYLKLGWNSKLHDIIKKDCSLPNGDYKRAWEIVNNGEDYLKFIEELKKFSSMLILGPKI